MSDPKENVEITPEQRAELREKSMQYYREEHPYLELVHQHHRLLAEIQEFKYRELRAMVASAQLSVDVSQSEFEAKPEPPSTSVDPQPVDPQPFRKLKTD